MTLSMHHLRRFANDPKTVSPLQEKPRATTGAILGRAVFLEVEKLFYRIVREPNPKTFSSAF